MNVHVAYRPEDHIVLGVFSSRKSAEEYRSCCSDLGRDIEISDHQIDKGCKLIDPEETQISVEDQCRSGWIG